METSEFIVRIETADGVDAHEYLWDVLAQLDAVEEVGSIMVDRNDQEERDISEVVRILQDLSDHEMEQLEGVIKTYTEEDT